MGTIKDLKVNVANAQRDTTPPQQVSVVAATYGNLAAYTGVVGPRPDPLYLRMNNIEAGVTLEVLNRSANPAAEWGRDSYVLPGSTENPPQGYLALVLSDQEAAKAGIVAGDQFFVRQTDCAGNSSEPTLVSLNQREYGYSSSFAPNTQFFGLEAPKGIDFTITPTPDARPPVGLLARMQIDVGATAGSARLNGRQAVEPFARIVAVNTRTQERTDARADITGGFDFTVPAVVGDTLSLSLYDHNGNSTELGTVKLGDCGGT